MRTSEARKEQSWSHVGPIAGATPSNRLAQAGLDPEVATCARCPVSPRNPSAGQCRCDRAPSIHQWGAGPESHRFPCRSGVLGDIRNGLQDGMMRLDRVPARTSALLRTNRHIGFYVDAHILHGEPVTTLCAIPGHENLLELGQRVGMAQPSFLGECSLVVALTVPIAKVHCFRPSRSGRVSPFGHAGITARLP
jgi:hypothetical protein